MGVGIEEETHWIRRKGKHVSIEGIKLLNKKTVKVKIRNRSDKYFGTFECDWKRSNGS